MKKPPFYLLAKGQDFERDRGTILAFDGDVSGSMYFLLSGWLAQSKYLADGHRQIVDILLPGEFLNPGSADPDMTPAQIEALTDVKFERIPRCKWHSFLGNHPEVRAVFERKAAAAAARIAERMLRLGKGSAECRIGYALFELCLRLHPTGLLPESLVHIPLTQQQLGDYCGVSAVHVCRILSHLNRSGVISVTDRMTFRAHDPDRLADLAEVDPGRLSRQIIVDPSRLGWQIIPAA